MFVKGQSYLEIQKLFEIIFFKKSVIGQLLLIVVRINQSLYDSFYLPK
jgi:hypothetical protein